jgi:hypothetical protein
VNEPNRGAVARPTEALFPTVDDMNFVRGRLKDQIDAGEIAVPHRMEGRSATPVVNKVVLFYLDLIGELAVGANPRLLMGILMAQLETNLIETGHLEAPPDAERTSAIIGHRFLIERIAADPPAGEAEPTPTQLRRMIAAAMELLNLGVLSDVLFVEVLDGAIWIDDEGYFCSMISGEARATHQRFVARMVASTGRVRDEIAARDRIPPDEVIEAEFGVTWVQLFALFNALSDFPDENMGAYFVEHDWFIENLAFATDIDPARIDRWVAALTLRRRVSFLDVPPAFGMNDVMPWRFNRRLSYFRRPLVIVDWEGRREVVWSLEHFRNASARVVIDIRHGSFRGVSEELESWLNGVRGENAERFNDEIADMVEATLEGVIVRRRIDTFAGTPMARENGDPIGDVDVLIADLQEQLLVLTETKDFRAGLVLSTLRDEIDALDDALGHVRERTAWIRGHLPDVAAELGIPQDEIGEWAVHPRIVTDEPLASATVRAWGVEIITFDDLLELVNDGVIA